MSPTELPSRFEPGPLEARWQRFWDERKLFHAPDRPDPPVFSLVLPPPNVTGVLTIGHMFGDTVMDVLVRWHRMRGEPTLFLPGVDHAGLSTQVEVRKRLQKQGIQLEQLPREEIVRRVEEWKRDHESRIRDQLRAGGFSLDLDRYRYTMDPGYRRATRKAFVQLYREGLIYRGERLVNWDPKLETAVSDLEVIRKEETTRLLYVRYPWADGTPGGIVVATVRPETIFGDVAVAVHPGDARHAGAVGRKLRLPLTDREVPVIADDLVDPAFGNGALKVTPGHDPLDAQIGRRHPELGPAPSLLDRTGHLAGDPVPAPYRGLDVPTARERAREELREQGLLEREEQYVHSVGRSERTDAVIEPILSTQWFVRMPELAPPAIAAVRSGEIRLHPARWELTFFRWMEALEDWCISRQVVWGHPIPVLYCGRCRSEIVEEEPPSACPTCGSTELTADPDVLDTWFSSWMWPFAAMGWPEPTAELERYFPTSVLVTGRDIMFFWVARMMMASYHFRGTRPFSDVYFTGMIRDEIGRKISKHLGNTPDTIALIEEWGCDALRFALLFPNPTDQDGAFKGSNLEGGRNFLTKVWNVTRLLLSQLPDGSGPAAPVPLPPGAPREDRWILARYRRTLLEVDRALADFELTPAAGALREFLWHDVADRYVEIAKEALAGRRGEIAARRSRAVLHFVVERTLRLLHPMVPHVTEELWHALPHAGESLALAAWPRLDEVLEDASAEAEMEPVLETIRILRALRSANNVPVAVIPEAWVRPASGAIAAVLGEERATIVRQGRIAGLTVIDATARPPEGTLTAVAPVGEVFLARPPETERSDWEALLKEREKLDGLLRKTRDRLADPGFRERAPPAVVKEAEAKAAELADRLQRIDEHLEASKGPTGAG